MMKRKSKGKETARRVGSIRVNRAAEGGEPTFSVVISTDTPQPGRYAKREVLSHAPGAVDLDRLNKGLPVTMRHSDPGKGVSSAGLPVGRVHNLKMDSGAMVGDLAIARSQSDLRADIEDGIITDVSVEAVINWDDFQEQKDGTLVARKWTPQLAALVPLGNDSNAVISREAGGEDDDGSEDRDRRAEIQRLFRGLEGEGFARLERDALYSDDSVSVIRERVDAAMRKQLVDQAPAGGGTVFSGDDDMDKWHDGASAALMYRAGVMSDEEQATYQRGMGQNMFHNMSLLELGRDYLRRRNLPVGGDAQVLAQRALSVPAVMLQRAIFSHTTSDFSNLLAGTSDKSLARGYNEANESYQRWTQTVTLSSFRQTAFPVLSTFSDLDQIPDTGEFTYGSFSDKQELLTLKAFGKLFSIGRQALINDDLGAFTRVPQYMGRAAARKVGDLVYANLTSPPTMNETSTVLFSAATHSNQSASGGAISTTTLDAATTAMGTQTDPGGATLNIEPAYLIVPKAVETTARVQMASEKDPAEGATTSFDAPNPFRNRFEVISDARLDASSTTAWFLAASRSGPVDTIAVGWLNGIQRPRLEQETGFEVDGIAYKVAIDAVAGPLDYRGVYKNAGA